MAQESKKTNSLITTSVNWHLITVMITHDITVEKLAELMRCSPSEITSLQKFEVMPKLNSDDINQLLQNISLLAGQVVRYSDLISVTEITAGGTRITSRPFCEGSLIPGGSLLTTIDTRKSQPK